MIFVNDKPVSFVQYNGKLYRAAEEYFRHAEAQDDISEEEQQDTSDD